MLRTCHFLNRNLLAEQRLKIKIVIRSNLNKKPRIPPGQAVVVPTVIDPFLFSFPSFHHSLETNFPVGNNSIRYRLTTLTASHLQLETKKTNQTKYEDTY